MVSDYLNEINKKLCELKKNQLQFLTNKAFDVNRGEK